MSFRPWVRTLLKAAVVVIAGFFLVRAVLDGASVLADTLDRRDWPATVGMVAAAIGAMAFSGVARESTHSNLALRSVFPSISLRSLSHFSRSVAPSPAYLAE